MRYNKATLALNPKWKEQDAEEIRTIEKEIHNFQILDKTYLKDFILDLKLYLKGIKEDYRKNYE